MKNLHIVVVALLASAVIASPAVASGNVNFFLGGKALEKDDWEPVESQGEFGAQITVGKEHWPVHIAIDVLGSADIETRPVADIEGRTSELAFGVRKIWGRNNVHPFVGGGIASIHGEAEGGLFWLSVDDADTAGGFWVDGGVFWRLGKRFNIGFDVRYSAAEITLFERDINAGGTHAGLLLGWGW
jgi:hypothetical protein